MADVGALRLNDRDGHAHTVDELTTLFDLCLVVADGGHPVDLHRLEKVVERIDRSLSGADCTVGVLVVGVDGATAVDLAGHAAGYTAVFADPTGEAAAGLGVTGAPALVWVTPEPAVEAVVHGWDGAAWRSLLGNLARKLAWTRPLVPAPGDPAPFPATPLAGGAASRISPRADRARKEDHDDVRLTS